MDAYGMAGSIAGAGIGLIGTYMSNKYAEEREKKARMENHYYNELAADAADKRTRALYEDYQTYGAQLQQIKDAGLSPSLLAGGAGAGGMTQGAQGAGATGINPTTYGLNPMEGAQLGLMQAQARKTNAEADTIEGKNDRGRLEINTLQLNNEMQDYENYVFSNTMQYSIEEAHEKALKVGREAENIFWNTEHQKIDFEFKNETYETRVNTEKEKFTNLAADTLLKNSELKLNEEQVKKLKADITQGWEALRLKAQEIAVNKESVENQNAQWLRECDQFRDKLAQDMLQFNKNLTYNYVKLGADTISKLASGGITGLILHAIPK